MKSLTDRFLEGLAEAVDSLSGGSSITFFNPTIAVLSALILTGVAAFSYDLKLPALVLAVGVVLALLTRIRLGAWAKILAFTSAWAIVVSVPLPFITSGSPAVRLPLGLIELKASWEGIGLMMTFISRVVASAAVFTFFASLMGWERIVQGLEDLRVPRELTALLSLSIIHIPPFLREASKMLSAREARIMRKVRFSDVWGILATVVGDLLLRSYEHAWRLEKAIKARRFTSIGVSWRTSPSTVGIKDLFLLSLTTGILALRLLGGL